MHIHLHVQELDVTALNVIILAASLQIMIAAKNPIQYIV